MRTRTAILDFVRHIAPELVDGLGADAEIAVASRGLEDFIVVDNCEAFAMRIVDSRLKLEDAPEDIWSHGFDRLDVVWTGESR